MRTSYFSENLEKGKVLEFLVSLKLHYIQCVNKEQIKEPSFQYTKYSIPKLFGFTIKFFVLPGIHFFFHDICHSFVCIADCHCSSNLKYTCFFFLFLFFFEYFLTLVISYFTCPPCLRKKYVSLYIILGIWPTMTNHFSPILKQFIMYQRLWLNFMFSN